MSDCNSSLVHKVIRSAKNICALIGLLFLLVTLTPLTRWWSASMAGSFIDPPTNGVVLIVLAGSVLEDGTIGGSSYWRAVYAVRMWRKGAYQRVLVCGGNSEGVAASLIIRDYLISQGIPADNILTETRSRNTRENALYAKPFLNQMAGKKVLLTSDYHIYRAQHAFSHVGIPTTPLAFPDVYKLSLGWTSRWTAYLELCKETGKIGYYKARGWI